MDLQRFSLQKEDATIFNPHEGASARVTLHSSESHYARENHDPDHLTMT
jgi:hypothetical protein